MKVLVTGHGKFASGLCDAYQLIAGEHPDLMYLEFLQDASLTDYEEQIKQLIQQHQEEGLIILTDLKGGTPFNISMIHSQDISFVCVLAGINLPMLLESMLTKDTYESPFELAKALETSGRQNLEFVSLDSQVEETDHSFSDGI